MFNMKRSIRALVLVAALICGGNDAFAHCQVPCGIYDDDARVEAMLEDVTTIEKALAQIEALSTKTDAVSKQQLVRWVMTKEAHAENIITTTATYFLAQRVKAPAAGDKDAEKASLNYVNELRLHHGTIVAAMKAKQFAGGDSAALVKTLRAGITALKGKYGSEHTH